MAETALPEPALADADLDLAPSRGWWGQVARRFVRHKPALIGLVFLAVFGALSMFGWVGGARIIRSQILSLRESEFVMAAHASGASTWRIIFKHLLPNVSNIIIVSMSMGLAGIAGSEIVLTWFGIGIQPPHPSFGSLIYDAGYIRTLNAHPHLLVGPAVVVGLLFFSFNLLGDSIRDALDPWVGGRR